MFNLRVKQVFYAFTLMINICSALYVDKNPAIPPLK